MTLVTVALKLLQASLSSVLAGVLVWLVLRAAVRRWPALASRRALWLSAQGVVASVCLVALLPHSAQWSVLPAMSVSLPASLQHGSAPVARVEPVLPAQPARQAEPVARADLALAVLPAAQDAAGAPELAAAPPSNAEPAGADALPFMTLLPLALLASLLLYPAGLAWSVWRLYRHRTLWRALDAGAQRLDGAQLRRHPAFTAVQIDELERHGLTVRETTAPISPMLLGLRKPRLLLPQHLRSFDIEQQQLIIEHELTHWRRADPWLLALASALQTVFWFNPALRWLGLRLSWAQELACDRQVLRGRPQRQRLSYAAALVRQLHMQGAAMPSGAAGLAFGGAGEVSVAARIKLMRQTGAPRLSMLSKAVLSCALVGIAAGGAVLQPALAWTETAAAHPVPVPPPVAAAPPPWIYPLQHMRVSSFYRVTSPLLPDGHHGIDLVAAKGTPIHAVAAGRILMVGRGDQRYGNFIVIEHAQGKRSLYAHLDSVAVREDEPATAGQVIGKVGATGMATGPHLHFEAYQDGQRIDPRLVLSGLDERATARALRIRKAQFGS